MRRLPRQVEVRTLTESSASNAPSAPATRPRKWRNRRPVAKRAELAAQEIAHRQEQAQRGKRKAFVGAFVTEAEKRTVTERAKRYGMKESAFIREVLLSDLKDPPPPRTDPEAVRALAFQLSKIGTNLNQLAHIANETHRLRFEADLRALSAQIAASLERVIAL